MVLDLSIPDLCPLSSFKQLRMAKDSFKDFFENINIILKNNNYYSQRVLNTNLLMYVVMDPEGGFGGSLEPPPCPHPRF